MYTTIATYYDTLFSGNYAQYAEFIRTVLLKGGFMSSSEKSRITCLDIGCGTGGIIQELKTSMDIEGLDISRDMIIVSQKKNPDITHYQQDIVSFNTGKKYDLILSLFDTINHIEGLSVWDSIFSNVHRHLGPTGVFIFDINTAYKFQQFNPKQDFVSSSEDGTSFVLNRRKKGKQGAVWSLRLSTKNASDDTHEENIYEWTYSHRSIQRILKKYFSSAESVDISDLINPKSLSEQTKRIAFLCRI